MLNDRTVNVGLVLDGQWTNRRIFLQKLVQHLIAHDRLTENPITATPGNRAPKLQSSVRIMFVIYTLPDRNEITRNALGKIGGSRLYHFVTYASSRIYQKFGLSEFVNPGSTVPARSIHRDIMSYPLQLLQTATDYQARSLCHILPADTHRVRRLAGDTTSPEKRAFRRRPFWIKQT